MTAAVAPHLRHELRRRRELVTPEGLSLPLTVASRGSRAGALLLDLGIIFFGFFLLGIFLTVVGVGLFDESPEDAGPAIELVLVLLILLVFLSRYGYFLAFELGPRGATPGKRALGIRVAARPAASGSGGRLTAEAVIARNLMRDVEVFIPFAFLVSGELGSGVMGFAAGVWLLVFMLFPLFNKDNLRAGDLVAGTWVVEAERRKLPAAMSLAPKQRAPAAYPFGEAELSVYGEHELQVLEGVLRHDNADAQRQVMEAICRKIGWQAGHGDERAFLEAFYAALRARLEGDMRFGKRKKDKFS
ncbi:MAG TPA: RDD family protein [Croceibacterium sp.]|nr:RDD family protein [Solirubrobacterales bacterium]HYD23936.1 RDD family protein [Croceibacterium sp.]